MARYRRSPRCSWCYKEGHTKNHCPEIKKAAAEGGQSGAAKAAPGAAPKAAPGAVPKAAPAAKGKDDGKK